MSGIARSLALLVGCASLGGCVAAIAPLAAAGAISGKGVLGRKGERAATPAVPAPDIRAVVAATPAPGALGSIAPAPIAPAAPAPVSLPTHGWPAVVTYVAELVQARSRPSTGAVLAPGTAAAFLPCGDKPFAVIVDADGTVLPAPGTAAGANVATAEAARAVDLLRFGHVTVLYTSARPVREASATESELERAKLGPAMQGRELLIGEDAKEPVRAAVAQHYCVLALVGDEASDFSEQPVVAGTAPWGAGWFRVPGTEATR